MTEAATHDAVDVLVVNYGTGALAQRAVDTVTGGAGAQPAGMHVWLWDNSGELLADPPVGFPVAGDGTNHLFAAANNALYARGDAPWVLLLNPDVELARTDVFRLVDALRARPDCWGVAPRLQFADGSDQRYLHALPTLSSLLADRLPPLRPLLRGAHRHYLQLDVDLTCSQVVEQPPAACLLVRREAVGQELFDPQYQLFFNDTDLARRLNQGGRCWYAADVTARHVRGASFERLRGYAVAREYDRALLRYARAHVRGWQLLVPVLAARWVTSRLLDAVRRRPAYL